MITSSRAFPLVTLVVTSIAITSQLTPYGPGVTNALYYPYKLIHNASHAIPLTPQEWASELECNPESFVGPLPRECYREDNSWLIKHNEEMWDSYKFLVRESSIDERYANLVYGFNSHSSLYFHHYKFNTGNKTRDQRLVQHVAGSQVDSQLCKQHLKQMVALLHELSWRVDRKRRNQTSPMASHETELDERHFRLARVLDSYGRYESGHLTGRYHSFGMYRQCIKTPMLLAHGEKLVGTRYCWARLGLDERLSSILRDESSSDYNIGDFKYHMATCLPVSCHSKSFTDDKENLMLVQKIVNTQYKRPRSMWIDQSLPVDSVFCLVDPDSKVAQMGLGGRALLWLGLAWLGLCVLATVVRRRKRVSSADGDRVVSAPAARKRRSFWSHFDLFESWHEFLGSGEVRRENAPVDLNALSLLRFLAIIAVLVVHSMLMVAPFAASALESQAVVESNRAELLVVTGILMIDSLFVLTGLLMTFIVLKRLDKIDPDRRNPVFGLNFFATWLYIGASRYLRLVPLYFLIFWFKKSVYKYLGTGPNWDYGLNRETLIGACHEESWLSPFTPMTALTPVLRQCLPQSWTISNDLLFAFMIPPFIIAIRKHFKATCAMIALTIIGSVLGGYFFYQSVDPKARFMLEQITARGMVLVFRYASGLYTHPIYRTPAILFGVLAGHALYNYEKTYYQRAASKAQVEDRGGQEGEVASSEPIWPSWFRGFATEQAVIYVVLSFVGALFTKELRDYTSDATKHRVVTSMIVTGHANWSLAISIIFLRMVTDWKGSWFMRFSSARLFRAIAKLAFSFLLIHWDTLYYDSMSITQSTLANKWQYGKSTTLAGLLLFPMSILIHVVLENPLDKLAKTYLLGSF